jgi:hypothetical protein
VTDQADERALLLGMPLVHLRSAAETCERHDRVVLPAGGPGDLDRAAPGATVLLMASDAGEDEVSAATWAARFVGRVHYEPGDPLPTMLPATWVETREADALAMPDERAEVNEDEVDEDEDEDEEDRLGPQSFLVVEELRELPMQEWVFTNELVGKQHRGGRTFFPRVPTLVRPPA